MNLATLAPSPAVSPSVMCSGVDGELWEVDAGRSLQPAESLSAELEAQRVPGCLGQPRTEASWPSVAPAPASAAPALSEVFRARWAHLGAPGGREKCEPQPSSQVWLGAPHPSAPAPQRASASPLLLATWTFLLPLQVSLGEQLTFLPAPHCSTGSLLGHFTFSPDPCNSVKHSQATTRPHRSWCLVPACKAQTDVSPRSGAGPGRGQVCGPRDGTDAHAQALSSTHSPVSASAVVTAHPSPGLPGAAGTCSGEGGVPHGHGGRVSAHSTHGQARFLQEEAEAPPRAAGRASLRGSRSLIGEPG